MHIHNTRSLFVFASRVGGESFGPSYIIHSQIETLLPLEVRERERESGRGSCLVRVWAGGWIGWQSALYFLSFFTPGFSCILVGRIEFL